MAIFLSCVTLSGSSGPSTHGVFVATSPCTAVSRSLVRIPATANCEMIKWHLALYQDQGSLTPTTYKLNITYGLPKQGTNGFSDGEIKIERNGSWTIVRGATGSPNAVIYQLDPGREESISFLKLDNNLLHLLDRDKRLAVGTDGWSYTLNRIGNFSRQRPQPNRINTSLISPMPPIGSPTRMVTASSILRRFVGRTPCREVAGELNREVSTDCIKVKWDLTLFLDATTNAPTTYQLRSTLNREAAKNGTWAIGRGTKANPDAIVYQLDPGKQSLSFLQADDNLLFLLDKEGNLLVGNENFSYTLNRAGATNPR